MPRIPDLPPDTLRLFGRIDRFTCECPRCAHLIRAQFKSVLQTRRKEVARKHYSTNGDSAPDATIYNPLTQRLVCPACRVTFAVGLLLYPVADRVPAEQPYDTAPTWKQLLAIRHLSSAIFLDRPIRGADSVNILVERECACRGRQLVATCPIHGWREQLTSGGASSEQEALEAEIARLKAENTTLKKSR